MGDERGINKTQNALSQYLSGGFFFAFFPFLALAPVTSCHSSFWISLVSPFGFYYLYLHLDGNEEILELNGGRKERCFQGNGVLNSSGFYLA